MLANSYTGVICAIVFRVQHIITTPNNITNTPQCILNGSYYISSQTLLLLTIGHFACCCADTLASEVRLVLVVLFDLLISTAWNIIWELPSIGY